MSEKLGNNVQLVTAVESQKQTWAAVDQTVNICVFTLNNVARLKNVKTFKHG